MMACLRIILRKAGCDCRFESNCPLVEPGTTGGMPSVGVFLRDPKTLRKEPQTIGDNQLHRSNASCRRNMALFTNFLISGLNPNYDWLD